MTSADLSKCCFVVIDDDEQHVVGVFSTRRKAEDFASRYESARNVMASVEVEEFDPPFSVRNFGLDKEEPEAREIKGRAA